MGLLWDVLLDWFLQKQDSPGEIIVEKHTESSTESVCKDCDKQFEKVKQLIHAKFVAPLNMTCTIQYRCIKKADAAASDVPAYAFDLKKISSRHKSSTIFSVCDYCGNKGKYRDGKGVDHNWQKDALMLHEAQHAIDWCATIRNRTIKETRAYYFFNLKQGSATDKDFIEALKSAVKRSTKDFQEDVFYATLKELMNQ